MKAVILAGGHGTRIREPGDRLPKPLREIGGRPILWHVMKGYEAHGVQDFLVCCGFGGEAIRRWLGVPAHEGTEVTVDLPPPGVGCGDSKPWRVTLVDTGRDTMTGGRLRRVRHHLDDTFLLTYGDGLSDVDITATVGLHREVGARATVTAVRPPEPYGVLTIQDEDPLVTSFQEKPDPRRDGRWINGGFFVVEPSALDLIEGDDTAWEREPLEQLARQRELAAYRHEGFWHPMDTPRDHAELEELWRRGQAPWRTWD